MCGQRGDVDLIPAALLDHVPAHRLREKKRALQVDIEDEIVILFRDIAAGLRRLTPAELMSVSIRP